jgi:hypothetical protein
MIMRRTAKQIERDRGAYHEAGHKVVAEHYGFEVQRTTLTECWVVPPRMTPSDVRKYIQVLLAGFIAQRQVDRGSYLLAALRGGESDLDYISELADKHSISNGEIRHLEQQTKQLVRQLRDTVENTWLRPRLVTQVPGWLPGRSEGHSH